MQGPAYRVVTPRLVVRCWEPRDAPLLKAAVDVSLDHLRDMPWARHEPQSLDDKVALLRKFRGQFDLGEDYVYGIFDPHEHAVIGGSGLHRRVGDGAREIGYWVHMAYTGKGYATEAAGALTRVGFEIDRLDRIEIHCGPANAASAAVARKLGYTHEATLRGRLRQPDGTSRDTMVWSLFAIDYPASPASSIGVNAFDAAGRQLL
jgi:RimJ/RimL family protein N-acetyltransferase